MSLKFPFLILDITQSGYILGSTMFAFTDNELFLRAKIISRLIDAFVGQN